MVIDFRVDGAPARFIWSWWTGKTVLRVGDQTIQLQRPQGLGTHFEPARTRTWNREVDGHDVQIVKTKSLIGPFGGNAYTISVDEIVVARASGF